MQIESVASAFVVGWAWTALDQYRRRGPAEWHARYLKKLRDKEEFNRPLFFGHLMGGPKKVA